MCLAAIVFPAQIGATPVQATGPGHANTFNGSCQLSGTVAFTPPVTNSPHPFTQHARARGMCSGSFTDRSGRTHHLNNARVRYRAVERASSGTCNGGTDAGTGVITFPEGRISFRISETRASAVVAVMLRGARGGSAAGQANVSSSANPVAIIQACGSDGLKSAPIQARAVTTPSISG